MSEKQTELLTIAYDLMTMSNVLKTNLKRSYECGGGVQAQDVARVVALHENAVKIQELAEGV